MAVKPPSVMQHRGTGRRGAVILSGTITIGAAGAVSASSSELASVEKNGSETGRYTVTFYREYRNVRVLGAPCIIGPDDAALTGTDGNQTIARNVSGTGFDIQCISDAHADAEPASGNEIHWFAEGQLA